MAFIVSLLSGWSLAWATPLWEWMDPVMPNLQSFLTRVCEEPFRASTAASFLLCLRQNISTVGQYAIWFCTLASKLSWNNKVLVATFWEGLAGCIKDVLTSCTLPGWVHCSGNPHWHYICRKTMSIWTHLMLSLPGSYFPETSPCDNPVQNERLQLA